MSTLTINRKPKGIYQNPQQVKPAASEGNISLKGANGTPELKNDAEKRTGPKTKAARARLRKMMQLEQFWPELFSLNEPKPLKIGVLEDLQNSIASRKIDFGNCSLKAALAGYTRRYQYKKALAAGGNRFGIDGTPYGEVTAEQQQNALAGLMKSAGESQKNG